MSALQNLTDDSSGYDDPPPLSQALEDHFPPNYNNFKDSNSFTVPVASSYEFAKNCRHFEQHDEPGQSAKDHLVLEYNKADEHIKSIYASKIAKHVGDPAWQALGQFGTLAGFVAISMALIQRLTDDQENLQEKTELASSPVSISPSRGEDIARSHHVLRGNISKRNKKHTQRKQKSTKNNSDSNVDRRRKSSSARGPGIPASIIRPCLLEEKEHTKADCREASQLR